MSAYQRTKGAGFEREISAYLSEELGRVVKRKLGQARDSGDDIQVGKFRIECKRRASLSVYAWLEQCAKACGTDTPVVIARADGQPAIAIMLLTDLVPLIRGELGPEPWRPA
jgi:Holliday junction resolvase